jgi:hypothetical protein
MKKLLISLFLVLMVVGCKTESTLECEDKNTFCIEFTNGSSDPYNLYVNDKFQQVVAAKNKVTYNIPAGYYSAKAVQKSGYLLYATVKEYSGTHKSCENYYIVFP